MSRTFFTAAGSFVFGIAVLLNGCDKQSPPGGPVAAPTNDSNANSPTANSSTKDGFKLEVPSSRTALEPGARTEVAIKINRDGNFKEPVALAFKAPEGVTAKPSKPRFEPNDTEVMLALEAAADAKPGEASVDVTGTPQTGSPTTVSIPVEVRARSDKATPAAPTAPER